MTSLTGRQQQQLSEAIRAAFTRAKLEQMLRYRLDKDLESIALGDDYQEIVFKLIKTTEAEGWTFELLSAARESSPGNPKLLEFAQGFNLTSVAPNALARTRLESIIQEKNGFLDVNKWRTRLGEIEPQVCRVEFRVSQSTTPNGTGFLVGPDMVITNYHVIKPVMDKRYKPSDVVLRFDYKRMSDGTTLNRGTTFNLAQTDWLIDYSPYSPLDLQPGQGTQVPQPDQLDYALLRVDNEPGNQAVGGDKAEPGAPARKWIEVSEPKAEDFNPESPLFIVQHPEGEPLKLAFDTDSIINVNANKTRVRYKTNTEAGSSGSPCFNINWELTALHHSGEPNFNPTYNQGIPFAAINNLLQQRGIKLGAPED